MSLFTQPVQRRRRCDIDMAQYVIMCDGQRVYYAFPRVWRGPHPILSVYENEFVRVGSPDEVLEASIGEPRMYVPNAWNRPWASPDDDDPRDLVYVSGDFTRFGGPTIHTHGWKGHLSEPGRDLIQGQMTLDGWVITTAHLQSIARAEVIVYRAIRYEVGKEIVLPLSKDHLATLTFDVNVPFPVTLFGEEVAIASGIAVNAEGSHTGYAQGASKVSLTGGNLLAGMEYYSLRQSGYVSSWDALETVLINGVIQRKPW